MDPELHLADETIKEILSRTVSYSAGKVKKQVQEKARQEFQKQIDQQKNSLQEEAKKKLQGLFGH